MEGLADSVRRGLFIWVDEVERWLDAYYLSLLERDLKESPHPHALFHAWYQKYLAGLYEEPWYEWEE